MFLLLLLLLIHPGSTRQQQQHRSLNLHRCIQGSRDSYVSCSKVARGYRDLVKCLVVYKNTSDWCHKRRIKHLHEKMHKCANGQKKWWTLTSCGKPWPFDTHIADVIPKSVIRGIQRTQIDFLRTITRIIISLLSVSSVRSKCWLSNNRILRFFYLEQVLDNRWRPWATLDKK